MRRLDDLLADLDCRALLVISRSSRDPFIAPFVGPAHFGRCLLIAPCGAPPRLGYYAPIDRVEAASSGLDLLTPEALEVVRWYRSGASEGEWSANVLSRALHLCELAPSRLAVTGLAPAGTSFDVLTRLAGEGWAVVAGDDLVRTLRKTKSAFDLGEIRRAAQGTVAAFRRVAGILSEATARDGGLWWGGEALRVGRLRRAIAEILLDHGLDQPEGNIVTAGRDAAVPHTVGDDGRVLRPGESIVVDVFPKGRFFADCTRTFCVGETPDTLRRAHADVLAALEVARDRARRGVHGWSVQEAVCEHLAAAGWPTPINEPSTPRGYVHGLGHGVGHELHELPRFDERAGDREGLLEAGDVFTLEPGLYDPDEGWGVRLEDLFLLGADGLENLTPLPYDLDPRSW